MALTLKKKSQNYIIDQGATFEKTIGAESSSSTAVTISSGTVAGGMIKNFAYANTLQSFTTSLLVQIVPFLDCNQTAALAEGKFYYSFVYTKVVA